MNIGLLRRIRNQALRDYIRVDMFHWMYDLRMMDAKECGTAGCIAGTACLLMGRHNPDNVATLAKDLLQLTTDEADRLFIPESWDEPYRSRLKRTAARTPEHGQVIADYIDHFTNGATIPKPRKKAKAPPAPEPEAPVMIDMAPAKAKQLA